MTTQIHPKPADNGLKNTAVILVSLLAVLFVTANVLVFGRDDSLTVHLNTVLNPVVAFLATLLAVFLVNQVRSIARARGMWIGLMLGWACWTVAEVLWTIAFLEGLEPPYPGWADLFWVLGYLPMFVALGMRVRQASGKPSGGNIAFLVLVSVAIIGFAAWGILLPIIQSFDPAAAVESLLNLLYPLCDTILIILSLIILFSARRSIFTTGWSWIAVGFIINGFSDLFFTYLSGLNQYYPDGAVNWMSVFLVDVPYTVSYLLFMTGLILLLQVQKAPSLPTRPQPAA